MADRRVPAAWLAPFLRRLDASSSSPVVVGLSGGSDSMTLLVCAKAYAAQVGRPLLALTVDHGLHPQSAAWTARAGQTARALGADWRALAWTGAKPATGLPAAARRARHALLATAAREHGARVVVLGHTADDVAESRLIRRETPGHGMLREWAPSPVWPEGRGVFLLRPLLELGRTALRSFLTERGLDWIDDPANDDPRFARSRARLALEREPVSRADLLVKPGAVCTERQHDTTFVRFNAAGGAALDVASLLAAADPVATLGRALLCVSGAERPARGVALRNAVDRLSAAGRTAFTLGGVRVQADGGVVLLAREPGRRPAAPTALPANGEPVVFDGRFELTARTQGLSVAPLAGLASRLPPADAAALRSLPARERPSLPAVLDADGGVRLPAPFGGAPVFAWLLVADRFAASVGEIAEECQIARGAGLAPHGADALPVLC